MFHQSKDKLKASLYNIFDQRFFVEFWRVFFNIFFERGGTFSDGLYQQCWKMAYCEKISMFSKNVQLRFHWFSSCNSGITYWLKKQLLFVQDAVLFITSPLIWSCEILPLLLNCRTKLNSTNLKAKPTKRVSHRAVLNCSKNRYLDSLINLLFLVYISSPFFISKVTD